MADLPVPVVLTTVCPTRRATLAALTAGLAGLLASGGRSAAQSASPVATPQGSLPPIVAAWVAAWNAHEPDQLAALYVPDGVYEEVPFGTQARGADAIRALVQGELATYAGVAIQPQAGFAADDWAVLQAIFGGRYTGRLPGMRAGSGQSFAIPFATVFRLGAGRIRRNSDYFDAYGFLTQIGVLTAPATATPAA